MRGSQHPSSWPGESRSSRRDVAVVVCVTVLATIVSAHYNLNEMLYALTRHGERFQIDELPIGMGALLICLVWLAWRRYRQAEGELRARLIAEIHLARLMQDNRALARENLRAHEAERKHLARELHDELGQYLNAIKLDAIAIKASGGTDAALSLSLAAAITRAIDHLYNVVTEIIARLRPVGLDELGLVAAIDHCIDHWRARLVDTQLDFSVRSSRASMKDSASRSIASYRRGSPMSTSIRRRLLS